MKYPLYLAPVFLCSGVAALADTGCYAPDRPEIEYPASLEAEYKEEIKDRYLEYFTDAQSYFLCLDVERQKTSAEFSEILSAYEGFAARNKLP